MAGSGTTTGGTAADDAATGRELAGCRASGVNGSGIATDGAIPGGRLGGGGGGGGGSGGVDGSGIATDRIASGGGLSGGGLCAIYRPAMAAPCGEVDVGITAWLKMRRRPDLGRLSGAPEQLEQPGRLQRAGPGAGSLRGRADGAEARGSRP
jgi:hypothetical protein